MSNGCVTVDDPRAQIIEDGTPEAHLLTAYEYRTAVFTLRKEYPGYQAAGVWRPISHLIGMCAELSMKAFLLQSGIDRRELKHNFGHGLEKLLVECIRLGLIVPDNHKATIDRLSLTVVSHFFRYGRDPGDNKLSWPVPTADVDEAIAAVDILVDAAARKVGHPPLLPNAAI